MSDRPVAEATANTHKRQPYALRDLNPLSQQASRCRITP